MGLDNDTRGWVMTCISGVACIIGASVICIDVFVRLFPGMKDFRVAESEAFLSASLSLSMGVMLFSALYSMLPQSKIYLQDGGYTAREASLLLIGLFLSGVVVIRLLSTILHHHVPTQAVDCDHSHDEENGGVEHVNEESPLLSKPNGHSQESPTLSRSDSIYPPKRNSLSARKPSDDNSFVTAPTSRRPSMMPRKLTRTLTRYVSGEKENCDENGPCMGFSDPCGTDCFKSVQRRPSRKVTYRSTNLQPISPVPEMEQDQEQQPETSSRRNSAHSHHDAHTEHHHHVPTNAFMSIGLQTSIAIALHKAPEGFITYATNHANPTLGFAVFMALFIHNITEGFAMSLPLYLALGSRLKAIVWSSILGGLSQPLGAGIAALWFKLAAKHQLGLGNPSEGVYGGMFAVTAGVMTSVALSLFSESMELSHRRGLCIAFAFLGMAILGFSSALTAKD
jgi:zinc transporter, ZIP family